MNVLNEGGEMEVRVRGGLTPQTLNGLKTPKTRPQISPPIQATDDIYSPLGQAKAAIAQPLFIEFLRLGHTDKIGKSV